MFDVTLAGAAFGGLLSFLSPCILPIVPFYLSYMAGVSMNQISADGELSREVRIKAVVSATFFSAGIITVFVALGATASMAGQFVREWFDILRYIAAALILAMGLHFLGVIRIGFLYRQFRAEAGSTSNMSYLGAYLVGLAFAFGWTPCVGPVLAAILFMAGGTETAGDGMRLLLAYGVGMTAPFIVAAMFVGPFMRWMQGFRQHLPKVEKAMGGLLVVFALLIGTNTINYIANWMVQYWPAIG